MVLIGVENVMVITKSVVSTPVDLDVKYRIAQGMYTRSGAADTSIPDLDPSPILLDLSTV